MIRLEVPARFGGRGWKDLGDALSKTAKGIEASLWDFAGDRGPHWVNLAIGMAKAVVYDAYTPRKYQRNYKLVEAIVNENEPVPGGVQIVIRNDTARVQPTHPKGGTTDPVQVPWEIEEGRYPQPWYGFTAARPYMAATAAVIDKALPRTLPKFVDRGLRTFEK